jgi:ABC-type glycerol-3-phosphate transport system substrate-binding protein
MKNSDGSTYFLPRTIASVVPFFTYYRQDWFEAQGIAEPKTIDELNEALAKIKKAYPDASPITVGLGGFEWMFKDLGTSFGCSVGSWVPDAKDPGKIVPSFGSKEQEDYFFWLQDLRRKGLLDPEVGVNPDVSHGKQKFMSGRAAAYPGGYPDFIEISSALKKSDPNAKVGIISPLTGPTGIKGGTRTVYPVDRGIYFSSKSDKTKDFFTFLEWWLTAGTQFRRYGVEGKTYKVVDGKNVSIPDAEREDAYKATQIEPLTFIDLPQEQLDFENWRGSFQGAGIEDKFDYWVGKFNEYSAVRFPDYLSPTVVSQTNKEIGAQIWEGAMAPAYGSVLLDTKTDKAAYEAAYKKWLDQGGSKIIDEINAAQTDKSKPNY